ncbi:hypothetical protein LJ707_15185 [Mucilaginibacter sp. UR6-1]|uniref:pirin family protein n=1 Tax=Mucilaginibacter sp. UR6-1 TaxID=1435643 RepID=UPI001E537D43|nr:hypothetical protein [Mucilaginibacter sp. UR6-1]MCC8410284.1 hypothetical protein [Mucilaginibacter sp. UR6-1]
MEQTQATIFLADDRGLMQDERERRFSTFNFGGYYNEHKLPFKNLCAFNEIILAGGAAADYKAEHTGYIILIPVTGAFEYHDASEETNAEAGEAIIIPADAGQGFRIKNPYIANWVSFVMINIETTLVPPGALQKAEFDIYYKQDELVPIISAYDLPFAMQIGRFAGRCETRYKARDKASSLFAFTIAGAFEAQNRLLHTGDGLALWDAEAFEAEALSNNAVLLVIELYS